MRNLVLIILTLAFTACSESEHAPNSVPSNAEVDSEQTAARDYIGEGQQIAGAMFASLSGELKLAMESGGVPNALSVCNVEAMALTDSMGRAHNVNIKRTALRYRNPNNAPTAHEKIVLENYEQMLANGQTLTAVLDTLEDGNIVFHGPIMLAPMCAKCHGDPAVDIGADSYATIKDYYPNDLAIGFKPGELRGMWSIVFN